MNPIGKETMQMTQFESLISELAAASGLALQVDAQDPSCAQPAARIRSRSGSPLRHSRCRLRARSASASHVGGRSIIGSGHFPRLIRRFASRPAIVLIFPVPVRRSFDILSALLRSGVGLRSRAGEPSEMMLILHAGNLRWSSGDEGVNPRWP